MASSQSFSIFLSKTDLVPKDEVDALIHRVKHMNPRAPVKSVHFGEVPIKDVFDLRGFNLNAKLDIDPDFLQPASEHDHSHCDHDHGQVQAPVLAQALEHVEP